MSAELFFLSVTLVPTVIATFIAWVYIRRGKLLAGILAGLAMILVFQVIIQQVSDHQYQSCLKELCSATPIRLNEPSSSSVCINWSEAGPVFTLAMLGDIKLFFLGSFVIWFVHRRSMRKVQKKAAQAIPEPATLTQPSAESVPPIQTS